MEDFKYRGEIVEVSYEIIDDDLEYNPKIILKYVYYKGTDILYIMNEADCVELKEEMYNQLFS